MCLWREMRRTNLPYAFILEDDVLFHKDWRAMLDSWEVDDPEWDLILLNASVPLSTSIGLSRCMRNRLGLTS